MIGIPAVIALCCIALRLRIKRRLSGKVPVRAHCVDTKLSFDVRLVPMKRSKWILDCVDCAKVHMGQVWDTPFRKIGDVATAYVDGADVVLPCEISCYRMLGLLELICVPCGVLILVFGY